MDISGGEILMESIANQGVKIIFGIPDGGFNIMFKWVHENGEARGLRFVTPRHEAGGGHMADAMARATGKPGVVLAGAGPGAANLVAAVAAAYAENIPVIVLTTSRRTDLISPPRGGMQVLDQVSIFKSITKLSVMVASWERIPEIFALAWRTALSGMPGPVHIDIPEDMLNTRKPVGTVNPAPPLGDVFGLCGADPAAISQAAEMIVGAKELLIHAGTAVVRSGATAELLELAEYLGCPVSVSPGGRGAIPEDHPQSVPPAAMMARASLMQADVVLAIGAKFGELDFFGKPPLWGPPGMQKLIHNHIAPEIIGLNKKADVPLPGYAKVVLPQLLEAVKKLTPKRAEHPKMKQYRDLIAMGHNDLLKKYVTGAAPVTTGELYTRVREFMPRETIFCHDGGNTSLWGSFFNKFFQPRTLMWTGDFGHLGTGLPFAVGAKLAAPEKPVCLISGDGAFGFNIQELETARRNCVNIIAIVAADGAWGMEKTAQARLFGTHDYYVNCDHSPVRWDKVAEAMGCHGAFIRSPEEIAPALKAAMDSGLPSVIHVEIDAVANITPPGADVWAATHSTK